MLFVLVCFLYVLSGLLMFIGLSTVALVCDCVVGLAMVAMLSWAFIRYSGHYRGVGGAIDQAAGVLLEQVRGFRGGPAVPMKFTGAPSILGRVGRHMTGAA